MHMNAQVIVLADPLRGVGIVRDFEKDGRIIVEFESDENAAEWDPPDRGVFDPHGLELAWVWERNATGSITDADIDGLLGNRRLPGEHI